MRHDATSPKHLRGIVTFALSLVMILGGSLTASAASEPYAEDPNGLVPFRSSVQGVYGGGQDVWEVWVCDVPGWDEAVEASTVAAQLNQAISPYFLWLSANRYQPTFTVGGTVTSNDVITADRNRMRLPYLTDCEDAVEAVSTSSPNGVLIVADGGYGEGYGGSGYVCPPPAWGCSRTYPANERRVVLGAGTVVPVEATQAQMTVVAHEIGHALSWAHSYGGEIYRSDGSVNEYDNIMDVMSGWELSGSPIGTHAYNRYAAGWIDPWEVGVYTGGTHSYLMQPIGGEGHEMVVIPYGEGLTFTMGFRTRNGWDQSIAKAGVETYLIDSTPTACTPMDWWPAGYPCFGSTTRVSPAIPPTSTHDTTNVAATGEGIYYDTEWSTSVIDDGFGNVYLRISDGRYNGRFVDDDGSPHEQNIEAIAALQLTQGCDPPINDLYCPSALVTRAEMATFLVRAIGATTDGWTYQGHFSDVTSNARYAPYVETLRNLGITTGYADGSFNPAGPVSRAEMAVFLSRAFDLAVDESTHPFGDVEAGVWYGPHVTALYNNGITSGCNTAPVRYCPTEPVPRDQMASFLARALG